MRRAGPSDNSGARAPSAVVAGRAAALVKLVRASRGGERPGWRCRAGKTRCHHIARWPAPGLSASHRPAGLRVRGPRGLLPCYSKMLLPGPRIRNSCLETLAVTTWASLLVITECRTSCKPISASRSTGQSIEISHCTSDSTGWSALKTISVLLNETVEPVPEMAFPFVETVLYLSGNTSGNCGIMLLPSSWACGRGDLCSIIPGIQITWTLASG